VRLILLRHGETESNRQRLALGREDVPLNEKGRRQAAALASSLDGVALSAVFASPLRRAVETARPLAEARALDVQVDEDLIEMAVGELEGLSPQELRDRYGDFLRQWFSTEAGRLRMPGGESLQDVQDRAWAAIERLRERHPKDTVAVVTHNFTIHAILSRALGLSLANFRRFRHDLAAKAVLDVRQDRAVVISLNDTCHLEAEGLVEGRGHWGTS
jgi:broad specificity phosphatase PhoE